ncbi:mechanosensitive ion channel domain-containing protein [Chromatium okenii]|uniref:mechanosensitive ion channel domain-containing protein n=1 Tax=Chromatium okenii TaxID=61644 RepID=UPI00308412A0
MIYLRNFFYFIALALAFLTAPAAAELPTVAKLTSSLNEVQAATNLDEALKTSVLEHYRRALSNLEAATAFDAKAAAFTAALKTAPPATATLLKQLKNAPPSAVESGLDQLASAEITQRLSKVLAEVALAETQMTELEQRLNANIERPATARARLSELKQKLEAENTPAPASQEATELALARRQAALTQREAWWAETRMLEQELLSQAVREALERAQRDQVAQTLQGLKLRQQALEEQHNQRRSAEVAAAQRASEQAQRRAEDQHPLVQAFTSENAQIVASGAQLAEQLNGLTAELTALESERKRIEADFRSSKQRLEVAGLSRALGQILLDHRQQLPDLRQLRTTIEERENAIAEATLRQIRYREEERQLRHPDDYLAQRLERELDTVVTPPSAVVRQQLTTALAQRQPVLAQALKVEDDFIRQLSELNYAAEQVVQVTTAYDDFLAERLLWVRSASMLNWQTLTALPAALVWLSSSEGWWSVAMTLWTQLQINPLFWLGLIVTAGLFWRQPAVIRAMRLCAEPVRQAQTDRVSFTMQALGLTLLAALPGALLLWVLGQQLQAPETTGFARAVGMALTETALGLYYLRAFRLICSSGGVAERHFRWRSETLKRLRRDVDGFTLYIIPVALLTVMVFHDNDAERTASLGRLLLVASMIGFTVLFARLLHPRRGVLTPILVAAPHGWLNRLRYLWFPASIALPLLLAGLALVGYGYTAKILFQSLVYQIWLALALLVIQQLIVRWLMVTRRRLAVQAALERQAARQADDEDPLLDLPEPDLAALDEQTRHLINAAIFFSALGGIWLTWSEVLPALTLFKQFALWYYNGIVDGQAQLTAVTVADAGLVAVILLIAIIAAKNLPALLEILLLQSHSVSAGERYAIKTLVRYAIVALAFIFAFSAMGFSWSQVQWLAAALSVGIGFGLQEIVANFISGLIILFERPVRVGDIVTIGDTSGVVTNIQIRATTIRNWDRQELLVPNKEFLTERLLNWTLTDQQNRISIPIGLEYGSDTRLALQVLKEIAQAHERVLTEPEPIVSFDSFADSALMLILRCYLDTIEGRIDVVTELHQAIYDRFSEHGLMMAFPQREVHLSTRQPLAVRLQQE